MYEPQDVTAEWLTEVFERNGVDGVVGTCEGRNIGTGQVGQNVRFDLTYAHGSGPASVVGKFASADPTSRATGITQNNYRKEVHFYKHLKPLVNIRTPDVLHADLDEASGLFCLMMEDLTPAVQGDQIAGCDVNQARLALTEAARLHGPTWNLASLLEDEVVAPPDADPSAFSNLWQMVYPGFVDRYRSRLEPRHLALLERFTGKLDVYMQPPNAQFALTHGDFRPDNMLFGGPYPVAVVDWQTVAKGHPLQDVAYLLSGLHLAERRAHDRTLVREYHDAIAAQGVTGYDFDTCMADYVRYSFAGLVMAVIASMIVGQTERGDDMFMAMAIGSAEQALDHDAEALLG